MKEEIRIPDIGDADEVYVIELCVAPGDAVGPDDALIVIESEKASMEVPAGRSDGTYQIAADRDEKGADRRVRLVAGGLAKLGELEKVKGAEDRVRFNCGIAHDALVGILLVRAPNVRSVLRELEQAASRGVLAAPSART